MSTPIPYECPRGRKDCISLARIESCDGSTFFCGGENQGNTKVPADRFTLCCKSIAGRDDTVYMDKRDMHHQMAVIAQALALVEKSEEEDRDWSPHLDL